MAEPGKVYALDEGKNQWETMTREQITAAILQAVNEGTITSIDAGFITKIQEQNKLGNVKFWLGTMAEFNALPEKDPNTLYLYTDDPTLDEIEEGFRTLNADLDAYKEETDARLDAMGFREGVAEIADGILGNAMAAARNSLRRMANFTLYDMETEPRTEPSGTIRQFTITVPEDFRPKEDAKVVVAAYRDGSGSPSMAGEFTLDKETGRIAVSFMLTSTGQYSFRITGAGWEN